MARESLQGAGAVHHEQRAGRPVAPDAGQEG